MIMTTCQIETLSKDMKFLKKNKEGLLYLNYSMNFSPKKISLRFKMAEGKSQ